MLSRPLPVQARVPPASMSGWPARRCGWIERSHFADAVGALWSEVSSSTSRT